MNEQLKALLASYGRSVLGAGLALYMSGVTDLKTLAYSLLVAPVALRAINPNDAAFGRLPEAAEVDAVVKKATVKKAPAKKPAAKKAAPKK